MSIIARGISFALIALLGSTLAACGDAPAEPGAPTLTVSLAAPSFTRDQDGSARIDFLLANAGDRSVGVLQCESHVAAIVERRQGERWGTYMGGNCLANVVSIPVALLPGHQRSGALILGEAGEYRLRIRTDRSVVQSSTFEVR